MRRAPLALSLIVTTSLAVPTASCSSNEGYARARVVVARADLVGGPRALGEVGDFRIENDQIRAVIQGPTHSRMLGIYGGGLLDVDLQRVRGDGEGDSRGGVGRDALGEIFPIFLLQAVEVQAVEVRRTGADGGPAQIAAIGTAGDFIELAGVLNRLLLGSHTNYRDPLSEQRVRYEILYTVEPGQRSLELTLRVTNVSSSELTFPTPEASMLAMLAGISGDELPVPIGDVAALSASSQAFIPGVGFDLRFGIERAARTPRTLPALPGVAAPWIATRGDGVSYGLVGAPSERNYAYLHRDQYGADGTPIDRTSVFIPFAAGGFVTVFYDVAPPALAPDESFEVTRHLVVGGGDVGSVLDEIHRLQEREVGRLGGEVRDALTNAPALDTSVLVYKRAADGARTIFSQYDVQAGGAFGGTLEPGDYSLRVEGRGRPLSEPVDFTIRADQTTALRVAAPAPGRVLVRIQTPEGDPLPARATLIGAYDADRVGEEPRRFLYDLEAGEHPRVQDLVPDDPSDERTRRYIEAEAFTDEGVAELWVRPGTYEVVASRGPEYDAVAETVEVAPGDTVTVLHRLTRVVDTAGWIAADMHLHSVGSHDSAMGLERRVRSIAAEGVEWAVASDHNFVADYSGAIAEAGLLEWLHSSVGLEVTTIESGHFNGYPLRYDVREVDHGAIEWSDVPPQAIFDRLRELGSLGPERTIVQVNHARQPVLGYFSQYRRDTFDMSEQPPSIADLVLQPEGPAFLDEDRRSTFSLDFDLLEVVNGKLFRDVHHFRVPEDLPPDAPMDLPETGAVVVGDDGQAVFPGVVEDWYTLLNQGHRFVGVGTSDSHNANSEAGYFRTMVFVGDDRVLGLTDASLVDGLLGRRVVATNGPVVDFYVDDPVDGVMGQQIRAGADEVRLGVRISAAPWISLERFNVIRNGEIAQVFELEEDRDYAEAPFDAELAVPLATDAGGAPIDTWFVIEVIGRRSMFPVVRPFEVSPFQITEAISTLTGGVSLFGPDLGSATPSENQPVTAYALTNPVWVTTGDDDFTAPGPVPRDVLALPVNDSGFPRGPKPRQAITDHAMRRAPREPGLTPWLFGRDPTQPHDLGAIMRRAALGHAH